MSCVLIFSLITTNSLIDPRYSDRMSFNSPLVIPGQAMPVSDILGQLSPWINWCRLIKWSISDVAVLSIMFHLRRASEQLLCGRHFARPHFVYHWYFIINIFKSHVNKAHASDRAPSITDNNRRVGICEVTTVATIIILWL